MPECGFKREESRRPRAAPCPKCGVNRRFRRPSVPLNSARPDCINFRLSSNQRPSKIHASAGFVILLVEDFMTDPQESTRRDFIARSLGRLGTAWLAANLPAILSAHEHARQAANSGTPPKFEFFSPEQAVEIEAVAAQIIPSDETPGAREARVIYFIDRALATFDSEKRDVYTRGLQDLTLKVAERFPPARKFSDLTPERQIGLLKTSETSEFFEAVRIHTVIGFLANPEYGGNHQKIGWKLIDFEDSFVFVPPFGYYDRDYKPEKE